MAIEQLGISSFCTHLYEIQCFKVHILLLYTILNICLENGSMFSALFVHFFIFIYFILFIYLFYFIFLRLQCHHYVVPLVLSISDFG